MTVVNQNQNYLSANHNKGLRHHQPIRSQKKTGELPKARENVSEQVVIGFSFASDWFKEWREFLDQSQTEVRQNYGNLGLLSTLY